MIVRMIEETREEIEEIINNEEPTKEEIEEYEIKQEEIKEETIQEILKPKSKAKSKPKPNINITKEPIEPIEGTKIEEEQHTKYIN